MFSKAQRSSASAHIEALRESVKALPIAFIDLRAALEATGHPLDFYALKSDGSYGHFTSEGYRLVARYLSSTLQEDGAI